MEEEETFAVVIEIDEEDAKLFQNYDAIAAISSPTSTKRMTSIAPSSESSSLSDIESIVEIQFGVHFLSNFECKTLLNRVLATLNVPEALKLTKDDRTLIEKLCNYYFETFEDVSREIKGLDAESVSIKIKLLLERAIRSFPNSPYPSFSFLTAPIRPPEIPSLTFKGTAEPDAVIAKKRKRKQAETITDITNTTGHCPLNMTSTPLPAFNAKIPTASQANPSKHPRAHDSQSAAIISAPNGTDSMDCREPEETFIMPCTLHMDAVAIFPSPHPSSPPKDLIQIDLVIKTAFTTHFQPLNYAVLSAITGRSNCLEILRIEIDEFSSYTSFTTLVMNTLKQIRKPETPPLKASDIKCWLRREDIGEEFCLEKEADWMEWKQLLLPKSVASIELLAAKRVKFD